MDIDKLKRSFVSALMLAACFAAASRAQTPVPSPSPAEEDTTGMSVTSSVEIGWRGLDVNGDHEKYRSDLNYRAGLRMFDSSFLIRDNTPGEKLFDTAVITASGWGSDPTGSFRFNMDRTGLYKFESNVRRVRYFNNLKNHAVNWSQSFPNFSEHALNTLHHFGDFDLTIFPERDLRFRLGYSFNNTDGPGFNTIRFQSDEFAVDSRVKTQSHDFRGGVEAKVFGFNLGFNYGHRTFTDRTRFFEDMINIGNNPFLITIPNVQTASSVIDLSSRQFRNKGQTDYAHFFFQRTFAKRFDLTGRFVYAESRSRAEETDFLKGRVTPGGDRIVSDNILVPARIKRPQSRGDIGATYRVTDNFRISDTFTFDQFSIGGSNTLAEQIVRTTVAGVPVTANPTSSYAWRATSYRRFSNLIEADYQFGRRGAFNIGYRYTRRDVTLLGASANLIAGTGSILAPEEETNNTNSVIVGGKIKPTQNWSIFADFERGTADNVFTRLANNDFVNFRVRSVANIKRFTANVSFITKDNDSPGRSTAFTGTTPFPAIDTTFNAKTRIFSSSLDWTPRSDLSLSGGYTYTHMTSKGDIIVPVGQPYFPTTRFLQGVSEFYARDSYFFFDVTARPMKRVSLYAAYRVDTDDGQGDRMITRPQDIITSYPMTFHTPEVRLAFKINDHIDWNVGYQYYSYKETPYFNPFAAVPYPVPAGGTPYPFFQIFQAQNYTAHMPYTSLRIYWGRRAVDR
jgi:hypothetical protein